MGADKTDVYDSKEWMRDMMAKPKSWLVDYLRNTLRSSAPSASHNSYYVPCFECGQLMCKAKTYYGSPECVAARGKHST